jgi:xylulokinase
VPLKSDDALLLGLDLGISTAKAALFDLSGALVQCETDEYLILPEGSRVETDPETYWRPVAASVRRLLARWGGSPEQIRAISVASHTETVIPLDRSGQPVRPALVWMDSRSQTEANELDREIGLARVLQISGQADINSIWPITKLRWMAKNEPDELHRTYKFLLPEEYLLYRLCGNFVAEQSEWSSSLIMDIRSKKWSEEMLEFAGISAAQLPQICAPGTLIGKISEACALETGLSRKTHVVAGALDHVSAAVAAGNIAPGVVTESTGSVLALVATVSQPILDLQARIPCHIHAMPDTYCLLPWNPSGGIILKWFKDNFVYLAESPEVEDVYDRLTGEAGKIGPGSSGLILLPHFQGALFPEYNDAARGVFFGVTLAHKRAHFVRAIMEAVCFMMRRDLEGLERLGAGAKEIRVLGGGARSGLWSQMKADICNIRVVVPAESEAAALGAAILAAVGSGIYPDIPSAVRAMSKIKNSIEPNPINVAVYDAAFRLYVSLYNSVKDLFSHCKQIEILSAKLAATSGLVD